jgi:hypothetical protein
LAGGLPSAKDLGVDVKGQPPARVSPSQIAAFMAISQSIASYFSATPDFTVRLKREVP